MPRMFKHWDIATGLTGIFAVVKLDTFNQAMAAVCAVLTAILLSFRVRSAWINRNRPPTDTP